MSSHKNLRSEGSAWERKAGAFLTGQGYQILTYNFRSRQAEADIVALDEGYLVFVEVKYRTSKRYGAAAAAVDANKQRRICKAALYYLTRYRYAENTPVRFDVVAIDQGQFSLIRNAFPFQLG